jgi:hypothetical protein
LRIADSNPHDPISGAAGFVRAIWLARAAICPQSAIACTPQSYAKKGIPVVFLSPGLHPDYHQVTDEPSKIVYPKLARVAMLMHDIAVAVANRRTRPR